MEHQLPQGQTSAVIPAQESQDVQSSGAPESPATRAAVSPGRREEQEATNEEGTMPWPCSHTALHQTSQSAVGLQQAHGTSGSVRAGGQSRTCQRCSEQQRPGRVNLHDYSSILLPQVFQGLTFPVLRGGQDKSSAKKAAVLADQRQN